MLNQEQKHSFVPQSLVLGGGVESHGSTRIPTYGEMEIVPECGCP